MTSPVDPLQPPAGAEALLFDCDGTLVDTLSLYRVCWRQVFGRRGFDMSDEWFAHHAGHHVHDFVAAAFPDATAEERAEITEEGMTMFMASTHLLEPLEHVVEIARANFGRIPMAVVSSGPREAVLESLAAAGITDLFDFVLTLDDVSSGKPDPEGYVKAIERIGVAPGHCVAYEDSAPGIAAARASGFGTVLDVRAHVG